MSFVQVTREGSYCIERSNVYCVMSAWAGISFAVDRGRVCDPIGATHAASGMVPRRSHRQDEGSHVFVLAQPRNVGSVCVGMCMQITKFEREGSGPVVADNVASCRNCRWLSRPEFPATSPQDFRRLTESFGPLAKQMRRTLCHGGETCPSDSAFLLLHPSLLKTVG